MLYHPGPMKPLVIIPTYNEVENIQEIVPEILGTYQTLSILVVDDNSPDGTGKVVDELSKKFDRLFVYHNPNKGGLGKAYLSGYQWAFQKDFDFLIQMDADFSHRVMDLAGLLEAGIENDLVVGSRYTPGGGVQNWTFLRKMISRGGSLYARLILPKSLSDWTGGFNGWKTSLLKKINFNGVQSDGYSFQIEMKYKALLQGVKYAEVPIVFEDRRAGESKMNFKIFLEALYRVWQIRLFSRSLR